jgi:sugar phosphate isomerase/epimerase
MNEIGIAGWALNRSIREHKTLTLLQFPALARGEFGVDRIELVSTFFESQNAKYLNELRQAIEKERLKVDNIAVDTGNLASPDEATRRTDLETIKQWFHVARALGSAAIRVNTGDASPDDKAALDRIIAGYQELAAHGAESGVKLLIENHGGASADPANIQLILDKLDTPWFATCPDVNNFYGDTWEQGMRIMAPRAFAVHIKNSSYSPDGWQEARARDGSTRRFNLKESLRILKQSGYSGPLNFEYNSAESDEKVGIRKGIEYTREMLAAI